MNIVLLRETDWTDAHTVRLSDHRAAHLRQVLAVAPGSSVRVGMIDGDRGVGQVVASDADAVTLEVTLNEAPGPRHPFDVVLALPRPKMLRRVLRSVAEFGVGTLHLIHSYRVEKSYWQSPLLAAPRLEAALLAGLERSGDTQLPRVSLHRRFRPFVEDVLPGLRANRDCLIAHPGGAPRLSAATGPAIVMIGPEGGFIPFEVELAQANGARPVTLGDRILSVDTALVAALALGAG